MRIMPGDSAPFIAYLQKQLERYESEMKFSGIKDLERMISEVEEGAELCSPSIREQYKRFVHLRYFA